MRVAVKLIGFLGCADIQNDLVDGSVRLVLAEDATADDLLRGLAEKYGAVFTSGRHGPAGMTRISLFIDNEMVEDPTARQLSTLRPQSEISVSLLRPLRGG